LAEYAFASLRHAGSWLFAEDVGRAALEPQIAMDKESKVRARKGKKKQRKPNDETVARLGSGSRAGGGASWSARRTGNASGRAVHHLDVGGALKQPIKQRERFETLVHLKVQHHLLGLTQRNHHFRALDRLSWTSAVHTIRSRRQQSPVRAR
jgi:hypothetical protein